MEWYGVELREIGSGRAVRGGVERSGSFSPISRWSGGKGLGEVDGAVGEHLLELLVLGLEAEGAHGSLELAELDVARLVGVKQV